MLGAQRKGGLQAASHVDLVTLGARLGADEREELKRLRKENRLLRMEKEILKKASAYFAKEMK